MPNSLDCPRTQMQQEVQMTVHTEWLVLLCSHRLNLCIWGSSKWVYLFECQLRSIIDSLSLCLLMVWLFSSISPQLCTKTLGAHTHTQILTSQAYCITHLCPSVLFVGSRPVPVRIRVPSQRSSRERFEHLKSLIWWIAALSVLSAQQV